MITKFDRIHEPARELPVTGEYDVVVAGGGIAGVAAGVAAARNGASVCLLERSFGLGGLATLGNVIVWLPLCDGNGRQVIGGLAEELLKLSVADLRQDNRSARFMGIPACWQPGGDLEQRKRQRYLAEFNPASYLLALEALVLQSGVHLLYDTRVCAVQRDGDRITFLIVENKSGRSALACRTVIDATGDADVCFLVGEQTESLDSNVLAGWFYNLQRDGLHLNQTSRSFSPLAGREDAEGPFFRGDDAEQVTEQLLGSRELIRKRLAELCEKHSEQDIQPVSVPSLPSFRMTRRLVGTFSLGERHMHQWFEDTVGLTGDWRKRGPVYAVPLRSLLGVQNHNLLAVGRCLSADTTAWDVTRAIPTCALTGAAAGVAAALGVQLFEGDIHHLSVVDLQRRLADQGFLLEPELVKPILE
jgi:hypothetical protein